VARLIEPYPGVAAVMRDSGDAGENNGGHMPRQACSRD
jgi:hypothetical protein